MPLTIMTPEWARIANEITVFILRMKKDDDAALRSVARTPMDLFNLWANERGCAISDTNLALWSVGFMQKLVEMPLNRLITAAEIDGLSY